jgi:hypothetical protein
MAKKKKIKWDGPENSFIGKTVNWTDEDFRNHGYMTVNEFVEKFSIGLKAYLVNNWKSFDRDHLLHPEDLTSNMLCYAESVYEVISIFGVGSTNED